MKTKKRAAAWALAALMLFGTLSYLAAIVAYAEEASNTVVSGVRYTLDKVYTSGGTTLYEAGSETYNKYDIKSGYLVDVTLRITDPDGAVDEILDGDNALVNVLLDSGSFSFTNTSKGKSTSTIKSAAAADTDGGVVYTVKLTRLAYSGTGDTMGITVRSKAESEDYFFSDAVTISQCVPKTADQDSNDEDDKDYSDLAVATPYIIVSNYSYGGSQITAGDTFSLTITLYNTSRLIDVENMMVTISMPDDLMLTSSSNTFYIDALEAEESITKTVQVTAKPAAQPQSHNVTVSMKYQYIDHKTVSRNDCSTEEIISIPVVQVDRFQLTSVEIEPQVMVGEEVYLSVEYVNKGRSEIYNLSAFVSGDNIENPGQNQNLGNLSSGATGSADFYIRAAESGPVSGLITVVYEDTNMQEKTLTIPFSTEAQSYEDLYGDQMGMYNPGMMEDPGMMEEPQKAVWPYWAAAGVVALVAVLVIVKRKRDKKRSEALDADL